MTLNYTVSKEKGGQWYAHEVGFPGIPCMIDGRRTFGDKKNALHNAAMMQGVLYKDYMELRRKEGTKGAKGGVIGYDPQPGKVR